MKIKCPKCNSDFEIADIKFLKTWVDQEIEKSAIFSFGEFARYTTILQEDIDIIKCYNECFSSFEYNIGHYSMCQLIRGKFQKGNNKFNKLSPEEKDMAVHFAFLQIYGYLSASSKQ